MISEGNSVKVHYTLKVDGEVMDTSQGGQPLEFRVGNSQVIPGFEKGILGMKEGERKSFNVIPEEGYGTEDPEGIQEIRREQLPPDVTPEEGMTLYAKGPDGQSIPMRVTEVSEETVVLNLNHPLAGKALDFDVEIVEVRQTA